MSRYSPERAKIAEEAAEWAVLLDGGGLSAAEKEQLTNWLLTSAQHVEELLHATTILSESADIDPEMEISIDSLLAQANAAPDASVITPSPNNRPEDKERFSLRKPYMAIAASVILFVGIMFFASFFSDDSSTQKLVTQRGEQREVTLDDGSVVQLNTLTELHIHFDDDLRRIHLLRGEAVFTVAHDKARPFRIVSGQAVAEAVGTQFNVRQYGHETIISVLEGKVIATTLDLLTELSGGNSGEPTIDLMPVLEKLDATRYIQRLAILNKGEQVIIKPDLTISEPESFNVSKLTAWREKRLVFESETLQKIAEEFNRYNKTQVRIVSEDLNNKKVSGIFDAYAPEVLIELLTSKSIRVKKIGKEILIFSNEQD